MSNTNDPSAPVGAAAVPPALAAAGRLAKTRAVLLVLLAVLPLAIAYFQPMDADDFAYRERVASQGFLGFFHDFYANTGGRILNIGAMYLNSQGPAAFKAMALVNGLAFLGVVWFAATIGLGRRPRLGDASDQAFVLLGYGLIWLGLPDLGSAVFWHSGSASYLLPGFFAMLFLRLCLVRPDGERGAAAAARSAAILAVGLVAASAAEQALVALAVGFALVCLFALRDGSFRPSVHGLGLAAIVLGGAVLLAAPGNYVRLGHVNAHAGLAMTLFNAVSHIGLYLYQSLFGAFAAVLLFLYAAGRPSRPLFERGGLAAQRQALALAAAACASMAIFAVVWAVSPRTFFYFVVLAVAAALSWLAVRERRAAADGRAAGAGRAVFVSLALSVLLLCDQGRGLYSNILFAADLADRDRQTAAAVAAGKPELVLTAPRIVDPRISYYTPPDAELSQRVGETVVRTIEPGHLNLPDQFRLIKANFGALLGGGDR